MQCPHPMPKDKSDPRAGKSDEEMARNIANLKGPELEKYIEDAEATIEFTNVQLEGGNLSASEAQALRLVKKTLEDILAIIETNRSN